MIDRIAKILIIIARKRHLNPMMLIQNTSNGIKPKAIDPKHIHIHSNTAKKKPQHLPMLIIKKPTIPQRMISLLPSMEIQMIRSIKLVNPIKHITASMAMHAVHQHNDPHRMRSVHQILKLLRGPTSARHGHEVSDMVAKAAVVGVLHYGHELDCCVAQSFYPRKYVLREGSVGGNVLFGGGHADVAFVDSEVF